MSFSSDVKIHEMMLIFLDLSVQKDSMWCYYYKRHPTTKGPFPLSAER